MSQRFQTEFQRTTAASADENSSLHPVLQSVLASLDVDLNDELTRYRRYAHIRQDALSKLTHSTEVLQSHGALAIAQPISPVTATESAMADGAIAPDDDAELHPIAALSAASGPPDGYLESSEELLRSLEEPEPFHDDEALPASEESNDKEPGFLASLLTPLGIGSVFLLVLSSATLGYLVVNPSTLGLLGGDRPSTGTGQSSPDASGRPSGIAPNLASGEFAELDLETLSSIQLRPNQPLFEGSPDAALDALSEEDPEAAIGVTPDVPPVPPPPALSVGGTSSAAVPAPTPRPAAPAPAARPASAPARAAAPRTAPAPAPASPQPSSSRPASPPSAPSPAPTPPVAAASAQSQSSGGDGLFRVVMPYTGDRSLEQAQTAQPDATVQNFPDGARVQFGAFSSSERAQSAVEELQRQGIPAQVYNP